MRIDLAEVVQVDYGVRLVGQAQNLCNGSRLRCLPRAPRRQAKTYGRSHEAEINRAGTWTF